MTTDAPNSPAQTESYPRQAARTLRFQCGRPRRITVSPDGARVVFVRSDAGDDPVGVLRVLDVATAAESVLADPRAMSDSTAEVPPEEAARRERMREVTQGVTAYAVDEAVTRAVFALGGEVYAVDIVAPSADAGRPRRLSTAGSAIDPRLAPDGTHIAYVSSGTLRVVDWVGEHDREVVGPSTGTVTFGLADFIAAEELGRSQGFWWSPDSDALIVQRTDVAPVATWWISDPVHPEAVPVPHRYPAAGTANAEVGLLHILLAGGETREITWDVDEFPYLADVSWTASGPPLVVVLDRLQRRRSVLAVNDVTTTVFATHEDSEWLTTAPGEVRWAPDGRLLAVLPDHSTDTYRLYADELALTPAGLQVIGIVDVSEDRVVVLAQDDPTSVRPYAISWSGAVDAAGEPDAWTTAAVGGSTTVLATTSFADATVTTTVHRADGTTVDIASHAERPVSAPDLLASGAVHRLGQRGLVTAVLFPAGHEPGSVRLPVLLSPYGGPGHSRVVAAAGSFGEDQWLADQGFVVIVVDGRGTPGRGPVWERAITDDLASVVLEDQIDALHAVADAFPDDVDLGRVGIRGWSFGGYLAALAVLRRPDVFHGAVAGAPPTDWRWYDTAYTERYLGLPQDDPARYDAVSLIPLAPGLRRPLLLVHGLTDDNVVVAHTLALSGALTAHGRLHSVLPLSGITHLTSREDVAENLLLLEVDFLRAALSDPAP